MQHNTGNKPVNFFSKRVALLEANLNYFSKTPDPIEQNYNLAIHLKNDQASEAVYIDGILIENDNFEESVKHLSEPLKNYIINNYHSREQGKIEFLSASESATVEFLNKKGKNNKKSTPPTPMFKTRTRRYEFHTNEDGSVTFKEIFVLDDIACFDANNQKKLMTSKSDLPIAMIASESLIKIEKGRITHTLVDDKILVSNEQVKDLFDPEDNIVQNLSDNMLHKELQLSSGDDVIVRTYQPYKYFISHDQLNKKINILKNNFTIVDEYIDQNFVEVEKSLKESAKDGNFKPIIQKFNTVWVTSDNKSIKTPNVKTEFVQTSIRDYWLINQNNENIPLPMVTNLANGNEICGMGWPSGTKAQEESLALCSNIRLGMPAKYPSPSLYGKPMTGLDMMGGSFRTEGCTLYGQIGRHRGTGNKLKVSRYFDKFNQVVVAAPDLRNRGVRSYYEKNSREYITDVANLAHAQCQHTLAAGSNTLIAGALGCGVFENDPYLVALIHMAIFQHVAYKDLKIQFAITRKHEEEFGLPDKFTFIFDNYATIRNIPIIKHIIDICQGNRGFKDYEKHSLSALTQELEIALQKFKLDKKSDEIVSNEKTKLKQNKVSLANDDNIPKGNSKNNIAERESKSEQLLQEPGFTTNQSSKARKFKLIVSFPTDGTSPSIKAREETAELKLGIIESIVRMDLPEKDLDEEMSKAQAKEKISIRYVEIEEPYYLINSPGDNLTKGTVDDALSKLCRDELFKEKISRIQDSVLLPELDQIDAEVNIINNDSDNSKKFTDSTQSPSSAKKQNNMTGFYIQDEDILAKLDSTKSSKEKTKYLAKAVVDISNILSKQHNGAVLGVPIYTSHQRALLIHETYRKDKWQTGINKIENAVAAEIEKLLQTDQYKHLQSKIEFLPISAWESFSIKDGLEGKAKEEWVRDDLHRIEKFMQNGGVVLGLKPPSENSVPQNKNILAPLDKLIQTTMKGFSQKYKPIENAPGLMKDPEYAEAFKLFEYLEDERFLRTYPINLPELSNDPEILPKMNKDPRRYQAITKTQKQLLIIESIINKLSEKQKLPMNTYLDVLRLQNDSSSTNSNKINLNNRNSSEINEVKVELKNLMQNRIGKIVVKTSPEISTYEPPSVTETQQIKNIARKYKLLFQNYVDSHQPSTFRNLIKFNLIGTKSSQNYEERTQVAKNFITALDSCQDIKCFEEIVTSANGFRNLLRGSNSDLINIIGSMEYDLNSLKLKPTIAEPKLNNIDENTIWKKLKEKLDNDLNKLLKTQPGNTLSITRILNISANSFEEWLSILQAERNNIKNSYPLVKILNNCLLSAKTNHVSPAVYSDLRGFVQPHVNTLLQYIDNRENALFLKNKNNEVNYDFRMQYAGQLAHDLIRCKTKDKLEAILLDAKLFTEKLKANGIDNSDLITIINKLEKTGDAFLSNNDLPFSGQPINIEKIFQEAFTNAENKSEKKGSNTNLYNMGTILQAMPSTTIGLQARQCALAIVLRQSQVETNRRLGNDLVRKITPEQIEMYRRQYPGFYYAQFCLAKLADIRTEKNKHSDKLSELSDTIEKAIQEAWNNQRDVSTLQLSAIISEKLNNIKVADDFKGKSRFTDILENLLTLLPKDENKLVIEERLQRETEVKYPQQFEVLNLNQTSITIEQHNFIELWDIQKYFEFTKIAELNWKILKNDLPHLYHIILNFLKDYNNYYFKKDNSQVLKYSPLTLVVLDTLKKILPNQINGENIKDKLDRLYFDIVSKKIENNRDFITDIISYRTSVQKDFEMISSSSMKRIEATNKGLPLPDLQGSNTNASGKNIYDNITSLDEIVSYLENHKTEKITWPQLKEAFKFRLSNYQFILSCLDDAVRDNRAAMLNYSSETMSILAALKNVVPDTISGYKIKDELNRLYNQVLQVKQKNDSDYKVFEKDIIKKMNRNDLELYQIKMKVAQLEKDEERNQFKSASFKKLSTSIRETLMNEDEIKKALVNAGFVQLNQSLPDAKEEKWVGLKNETVDLRKIEEDINSRYDVDQNLKVTEVENQSTVGYKLKNPGRLGGALVGCGFNKEEIEGLTPHQLLVFDAIIHETKTKMVEELIVKDSMEPNLNEIQIRARFVDREKFEKIINGSIKEELLPIIRNAIQDNYKISTNRLKM